ARSGAEAVRVSVPAAVPRVQEPTAATPEASLTALAPVMEPPPEATAKVTVTPGRGLPLASRTRTAGAVLTAVPAAALWLLPTSRTTCGARVTTRMRWLLL